MLGMFDSGFGGLTILRAVRDLLPMHDILYLGDNARTPYGNRNRETVTKYTKECCALLFDHGCSLIVLACHTASADTLRDLQQNWIPLLGLRTGDKGQGGNPLSLRPIAISPRNIIGVIRPLVEAAMEYTKNNRIGVVGTRGTVASRTYIKEVQKLKPEATVIQQACPLLVPLVEEEWEKKPETKRILRAYLASLKSQNPDVLILGCTHYEVLHDLFVQKMGSRCKVLHSPSIVAQKLVSYLERHPEYDIPQTGKLQFLTTGDAERFAEIGSHFFGQQIRSVQHAEIRETPCQENAQMLVS